MGKMREILRDVSRFYQVTTESGFLLVPGTLTFTHYPRARRLLADLADQQRPMRAQQVSYNPALQRRGAR